MTPEKEKMKKVSERNKSKNEIKRNKTIWE